jgi:hypothetical protein
MYDSLQYISLHSDHQRQLHTERYLNLFFSFFLITDNFIALIAVNNSLGIQLLPSIPSC